LKYYFDVGSWVPKQRIDRRDTIAADTLAVYERAVQRKVATTA
jgi:hypothetical protein